MDQPLDHEPPFVANPTSNGSTDYIHEDPAAMILGILLPFSAVLLLVMAIVGYHWWKRRQARKRYQEQVNEDADDWNARGISLDIPLYRPLSDANPPQYGHQTPVPSYHSREGMNP